MIGITPAGSDKEILIFESATIVDYVCEHFGRQMMPKRYPDGNEGVLGAENEDFMRYRVSYTFLSWLYGATMHQQRMVYSLAASHRLCHHRCYTAALSHASIPIKQLHHQSYSQHPRANLHQFLMDYAEGSLMTLLMIAMVISSTSNHPLIHILTNTRIQTSRRHPSPSSSSSSHQASPIRSIALSSAQSWKSTALSSKTTFRNPGASSSVATVLRARMS